MNTWKPALLPEDPEKNKKFLAEYGLVPSLVLIDNFGDRMFRHGAYSTSQKDVQKENMKLCKDGIDFAKALGCIAYCSGRRMTGWTIRSP